VLQFSLKLNGGYWNCIAFSLTCVGGGNRYQCEKSFCERTRQHLLNAAKKQAENLQKVLTTAIKNMAAEDWAEDILKAKVMLIWSTSRLIINIISTPTDTGVQ